MTQVDAKFKSFKGDFLKRFGLEGFPWLVASLAYLVSYTWLFVVRDSLWIDDWYLVLSQLMVIPQTR